MDEALDQPGAPVQPRVGLRKWRDQQVVPEKWIAMARTPGPANQTYGFMNWFLNTDQKPMPSVPATAVTFQGSGSNIIYIDWEHDLG